MYPPWMLEMPAPQLPAPLDKSGFDFIDSTSSLAELAEALSSVREFAVDLEHSDRCVRLHGTSKLDFLPIFSHCFAGLAW